jgi:hypothetical protein
MMIPDVKQRLSKAVEELKDLSGKKSSTHKHTRWFILNLLFIPSAHEAKLRGGGSTQELAKAELVL